MRRRSLLVLAFVLGACGTAEVATPDVASTPVPTVAGVGRLPDTVPPAVQAGLPGDEPVVSVVVTRPVDDDGVVVETVAERVNGNRLLVIGDSILASTATRYGKELCTALNPLGWSVEVDAEPGRFVEFGNKVLQSRLPDDVSEDDDWDAAVVHLGSNYDRDQDNYFEELNEILYRLAPRPTLVLTVTEYRAEWAEVNESIRDLADLYDNVTVVDWEKIARTPGILSRDGLHPGDQGEDVLVELIALSLGSLGGEDGECLRSSFTDDSAIGSGSGSGSGGSSSGSSSGGSSSGSSSSGSSSSGGSSSGSSSGGSSSGGSSSGGSTTGSGSTSGGSSTGGSTTGDTTGDTTGGTGDTTDGTSGGDTAGGDTTGGTDGGSDSGADTGGDDGSTTGGDATTGGAATGGTTTGGSTTGGDTTGGSTTGGSTGGSTTGGSTTGSTTGGSTTGGSTTGGTSGTSTGTTGGSSTGTTSGGSTTGGSTTGGSTTGADAATGGIEIGVG